MSIQIRQNDDSMRAPCTLLYDWSQIPDVFGQPIGAGVFGTPEFAQLLQTNYLVKVPGFVTWEDEKSAKAAAVAYLRQGRLGQRCLYSLPYGLTAKDDKSAAELLYAIKAYCNDNGVRFAEITSGTRMYNVPFATWQKTTVVKQLEPDIESNWKAFRAKTRNLVRKAEKNGVVAERGSIWLRPFYEIYLQRMSELGIACHKLSYFENLIDNFGQNAELYAGCQSGRLIGGMIFIHGSVKSYYMYNASNREGRSVGVNDFLMWQAMQDCVSRGIAEIDLGEATPGSSVYRFKTKEIGGMATAVTYYDPTQDADVTGRPIASNLRPWPSRLSRVLVPHLPNVPRRALLKHLKRYSRLV